MSVTSSMTGMTGMTGRARRREAAPTMSLPMIIGLVLVSVFAFAALVLLTSYSDELRADEPMTATATDPSAVGYTGLQMLLSELDYEVRVDPYPAQGRWNGRDIRLYFPTGAFSEDRRERMDPAVPGLFILPKWRVQLVAEGSTDVIRWSNPGLSNQGSSILRTLSEGLNVATSSNIQADWNLSEAGSVRFLGMAEDLSYPRWVESLPDDVDVAEEDMTQEDAAPSEEEADPQEDDAQSDETETDEESDLNETVEELFGDFGLLVNAQWMDRSPTTADEVLYPLPDQNLLLLAEPDLLSNHGIATEARAQIAVLMLADVARYFDVADPVFVFDDSLRRRDTSQNLVKLLTRPPFLAATLCLLAAGALIGWQGFNRFGDAVRGDEDAADTVSRGPRALAETSAQFIQGAGRLDGLAPNYANVVWRQALQAMGLSVSDRKRAEAAIRSRETLREISPTFEAIKANQTLTPISRAQALQRWKEDIIR